MAYHAHRAESAGTAGVAGAVIPVGWGTPVSPYPNRWWERLAPPTGRGAVRQAHRRWGTPVSPCPNRWWERLAPHRQGEWGNPVSPCPNCCWKRLAPPQAGARFDRLTAGGEPRFPHRRMHASSGRAVPSPQGGGWGNLVSPYPNRWWERLAPPTGRGNGETRFPHRRMHASSGRAVTSQTLPHREGAWGNPVSPYPNRWWERLAPPTGRGAVRQAHRRWGTPVSPYPNRWWERLAPPTGRGAVRQAHRRWGNLVSPYFHIRRSCAWRTTPE